MDVVEERGAKRFKLPEGFDQVKHRAQLDRTIAENPRYGAGWVIDHIDIEEGYCYVVKKAQIHEVVSGDHESDIRSMRLAAGTKTSDGDAYSQWVGHSFPGFEVVVFEPGAGRAVIAKLPADLSRCRTALATALGCKPWGIKVSAKRRPDGSLLQYDTTLPASFTPTKHGPKLTEVAQEIVGNLGWRVEWDAMKLTATLIAGDPPMLPAVAPYPFEEQIGKWNDIPVGPALGGGVARWDLSAAPHLAIAGITGSGKRQPLTTRIPTPLGWTTIGDLSVDDFVFAADGNPARVIGLAPIVDGDIFEIELSDGQVVSADGEHLWKVSSCASRAAHATTPSGRPAPEQIWARVRRRSWAFVGAVGTASTIASIISGCGGPSIDADTIEAALIDIGLPAVPVVAASAVGGPGTFADPAPSFPIDEALVMISEEFARRTFDSAAGLPPLERIVSTVEMFESNPFAHFAIRVAEPINLPGALLPVDPYLFGVDLVNAATNGSEGRRIPVAYLRASCVQRLALLQGIMDAGGTIDSGECGIALFDESLRTDVLELVRSLGIIAKLSCELIRFVTDLPVFRLARKRSQLPTELTDDQRWLHVVDVRRVASVPARCISLDHPAHLYLTDHFVPTHNTIAQEAVIVGAMARGFEVAIVDPTKGGVDFAWAEKFCRPGGWGCENLEEALTAISLVYAEGTRRKGLIKAKPGAVKWTDLEDPTIKPILLVADECTSLLAMEAAPKGLPKTDPIAVEIAYRNSVKARILNVVGKIARELRFVGVHLMLGSQKFYAEIVSGEMRSNLGARILLGANPTNADRSMALRDVDAVPNIPAYLRDDPKVARGIGVYEIEGVGAGVFKGFFATHDDFAAYARASGCRELPNTRPTADQVAEHCPTAISSTKGDDDGEPDRLLDDERPRRSPKPVPKPAPQGAPRNESCPTCGGQINLLTGECHCSW